MHSKILKDFHSKTDDLVIDELCLEHGKNRIDIAVFSKFIHGYEIKSSQDNLLRLQPQLEIYSKSMQKLTFVVAENHLDQVIQEVPQWCGIILVCKGTRGAINFKKIRRALLNPNIETFSLAHLLWRNEAVDLLKDKGFSNKTLTYSKKDLYRIIADTYPSKQLIEIIKIKLKSRETWRVDPLLLSYDG
ncbi:sce7726 family protein [Acinetobacter indicus]|nr:sce7726 family protein [Acinetobacter indicus]